MKNQYDLEQFAISLISLMLIRNDHFTQKNVRFDAGLVADIVARKHDDAGTPQNFVVIVKWFASSKDIDKELTAARSELEEKFGMTVYFACVISDGYHLVVDAPLNEKMLYSPDEISVTFLEPDNSAAMP
jgi:hypothetical protein